MNKNLLYGNNSRMIKTSITISQVKDDIERLRTKKVEVTLNLGRNKFVVFCGTLIGVYPSLFTVKPEQEDFKVKTSYSYSEYLCGKVRIRQKAE